MTPKITQPKGRSPKVDRIKPSPVGDVTPPSYLDPGGLPSENGKAAAHRTNNVSKVLQINQSIGQFQ